MIDDCFLFFLKLLFLILFFFECCGVGERGVKVKYLIIY